MMYYLRHKTTKQEYKEPCPYFQWLRDNGYETSGVAEHETVYFNCKDLATNSRPSAKWEVKLFKPKVEILPNGNLRMT